MARIHITELADDQRVAGAVTGAVFGAHNAVAELVARDAADREARVERLTRWTAGDREAARAQEEAATDDIAH